MPVRSVTSTRRVLLAAAVALLLALLAASVALANVGLSKFVAKARGNVIVVTWETQTEFNTSEFELYRAESAAPGSWGAPIDQQPAKGGVAPATYTYIDPAATPGVMYYYLLKDVPSNGGAGGQYGPVPARILPYRIYLPTLYAQSTTAR
jgi:hypothetical protein